MSAHLRYLRDLSPSEQAVFATEFGAIRKSPTIGKLLAFFLGGFGTHRFYLGEVFIGVIYLAFCFTFIPAIISFFETFLMGGRIADYNDDKAREIAERILLSRPRKPGTPSSPQAIGGW